MDAPIIEKFKDKTFVNEIELSSINEFHRSDVKNLIHLITSELKSTGCKIQYVFLPFRSQNNDKKLSVFLQKVLQNLNNSEDVKKRIKKTDCFTLVSALKFLWCRLPDSCIIGWSAYEKFKHLERKQNYPKNAFLEIMPACLPTPEHASIVYDFLDLLIRLAAYKKDNCLSGRKIAKLAGLWAFSGPPPASLKASTTSSATMDSNFVGSYTSDYKSFIDGLEEWLPAGEATFHLLLAFLRSMLPAPDSGSKVKIQSSLQSLLAANTYPPESYLSTAGLTSMPLVTVYSKKLSLNPLQLLARTAKTLNFERSDLFDDSEEYKILSSLFKDTENIINKLTPESQKIVEQLCSDKKYYLLKSGWLKKNKQNYDAGYNYHKASLSRISIDDYYIWAWMSSVSSESSAEKRGIFGNSLVAEFQYKPNEVKWMIIQECLMDGEEDDVEDEDITGSSDEYENGVLHTTLDHENEDSEPEETFRNIQMNGGGHQKAHHRNSMPSPLTKKQESPKRRSMDPNLPQGQKSSPQMPAPMPAPIPMAVPVPMGAPMAIPYGYEQYPGPGYYYDQRAPPPVGPAPNVRRSGPGAAGLAAPAGPGGPGGPGGPTGPIGPTGPMGGKPLPNGQRPQMQPVAGQQQYYEYYYDPRYYQQPVGMPPPQMQPMPVHMPYGRVSPTRGPQMMYRQGPPSPPGHAGPPAAGGAAPVPPLAPVTPQYRGSTSPKLPQGANASGSPTAPQPMTRSDLAIAQMPTTPGFSKLHGAKKQDKKALRSALVGGNFGI